MSLSPCLLVCLLDARAGNPLLALEWSVTAAQVHPFVGLSVASAGDVNGDGYDDVVVDAAQEGDGLFPDGGAHVALGSATGLAFAVAFSGDDTILPPDLDDDEDFECPNIEHIPVKSPQIIGTDVVVNASITDDSDVLSAILYYKRETSITWDDQGMQPASAGSSIYSATIPGKEVDGAAGMHYYIWAQDASPNLNACTLPNDGEEGPFHFTIDAGDEDADDDGVDDDEDCDDTNADVYPGAEEICDGTIDHDCDGTVDDGCEKGGDDGDGGDDGGGDDGGGDDGGGSDSGGDDEPGCGCGGAGGGSAVAGLLALALVSRRGRSLP